MNQKNTGLSFLGGALLVRPPCICWTPKPASAGVTPSGPRQATPCVAPAIVWATPGASDKLGADLIGHAHDIGSHLADHALRVPRTHRTMPPAPATRPPVDSKPCRTA